MGEAKRIFFSSINYSDLWFKLSHNAKMNEHRHQNPSLKSHSRENSNQQYACGFTPSNRSEKGQYDISVSICYEIAAYVYSPQVTMGHSAHRTKWFMAFRWHNYSLLLHMFAFVLNCVQLWMYHYQVYSRNRQLSSSSSCVFVSLQITFIYELRVFNSILSMHAKHVNLSVTNEFRVDFFTIFKYHDETLI